MRNFAYEIICDDIVHKMIYYARDYLYVHNDEDFIFDYKIKDGKVDDSYSKINLYFKLTKKINFKYLNRGDVITLEAEGYSTDRRMISFICTI